MGIPVEYRKSSDKIISYNWSDIASGQEYINWFPTISRNSVIYDYILTSTELSASTSTGLLATNGTYNFMTSVFNRGLTIKGVAYLSGYADYTSGSGIVLSAQLKKENYDNASIGAVITSNATEVVSANVADPWELKKTLTCNTKVYSYKADTKCDIFLVREKIVFNYSDGSTIEILETTESADWINIEILNPYQEKEVTTILIYLEDDGYSPQERREKNSVVYGLVYESSNISSAVLTNAISADGSILLKIDLTETKISKGDIISLILIKSGGTGGFVVDPVNAIHAKQSLFLTIPIKIDL
jgi:hypothetical protein